MIFKLVRFALRDTYTIGRLYCDGKYICDTLEPPSRRLSSWTPKAVIVNEKRYCTIAIPTGTYKVELRFSVKFYRFVPQLLDVKGFDGILIHPGNYPRDTRGCILPGWNRRKGMVCGSVSALEEILYYIKEARKRLEEVKITIVENAGRGPCGRPQMQ